MRSAGQSLCPMPPPPLTIGVEGALSGVGAHFGRTLSFLLPLVAALLLLVVTFGSWEYSDIRKSSRWCLVVGNGSQNI